MHTVSDGVGGRVRDLRLRVVLEVRADPGDVGDDVDAEIAQVWPATGTR